MSWTILFVAGLFEIAWAVGLHYSAGFTRPIPSILTIISLIISFVLLGLAVRGLPIGTAYAIWTGIGAAGTAICGIILFDEPKDATRIVCLLLIVTGVIGLKFSTR